MLKNRVVVALRLDFGVVADSLVFALIICHCVPNAVVTSSVPMRNSSRSTLNIMETNTTLSLHERQRDRWWFCLVICKGSPSETKVPWYEQTGGGKCIGG